MRFPVVYRFFITLTVVLLLYSDVQANNIVVSDGPHFRKVIGQPYAEIQFGLMWEHSWHFKHKNRHNITNWDAAWVFVKYSANNEPWRHVYLDSEINNHRIIEASDSVVMKIGTSMVGGTERAMGVFVHRDTAGNGIIEVRKAILRWNFEDQGVTLTAEDTIKLRMFAIEMVYIPEGPFYFGDCAFTTHLDAKNRYVSAFNQNGNIVDATAVNCATGIAPISPLVSEDPSLRFRGAAIQPDFPKGFKGIYVMKHNISQHAYVDFLNTLTYTQQAQRTWNNNPAAPMNTFVMGPNAGTTGTTHRNYIRIRIPGAAADQISAMYGHSIGGGFTSWDRDSNGGNVACNFMNIFDGLAYADWAGLRPMTEMEFEKITRGPIAPFTGEYAWGARFVEEGHSMQFAFTGREFMVGNFRSINGAPIRVGSFAHYWTTREESGGAYYGPMNMSDNVWERVISLAVGSTFFDGRHGDGELDANGFADVQNWPSPTNFRGWGTRGNQISNRTHAETLGPETTAAQRPTTLSHYGFRAVRTAP
jgi:hypothetical protein